MTKAWSLKNCWVGQLEPEKKAFGAGQEEGSGLKSLISAGISERGKNPTERKNNVRFGDAEERTEERTYRL